MFEQASIGLGREETQRIFLSMKQLVYNFPLANVRFWGKLKFSLPIVFKTLFETADISNIKLTLFQHKLLHR